MTQDEFGAIVAFVIEIEVSPAAGTGENVGEPQPVVFTFGGFAKKTLAGRLSVSETCVRLLPCSLFLIRMESRLVCPAQIVPGLKLLLTEGTGVPVTFKVALAGVVLVMFAPPPVEVSSPAGIVLIRLSTAVAVTLTDTVHDPGVVPDCAGTVPPLRDRFVPPTDALTEPPQEFVKTMGFAMVRPGCTPIKLSVQEALVNGNPLGLKMVTLRRDVPPARIEIGEKLLLISAGKDMTCANAICTGITRLETISVTTRKGMSDLRIFSSFLCRITNVKQTKPTQHGRFRHWLTSAHSTRLDRRPNWAMDQSIRYNENLKLVNIIVRMIRAMSSPVFIFRNR